MHGLYNIDNRDEVRLNYSMIHLPIHLSIRLKMTVLISGRWEYKGSEMLDSSLSLSDRSIGAQTSLHPIIFHIATL